MADEPEERKGTIMDHMTFMTIFSLLATVGMVLVITWGMSTVDPHGQGWEKRVAEYQTQDPVREGGTQ